MLTINTSQWDALSVKPNALILMLARRTTAVPSRRATPAMPQITINESINEVLPATVCSPVGNSQHSFQVVRNVMPRPHADVATHNQMQIDVVRQA